MKEKNIIGLFFTDLHLSDLSLQVCKDFIGKMCIYSKENNIKNIIFGGDFFECRKGLTQDTLIVANEIFENLHELQSNIYFLVGNHDKANPLINNSYLTPFKKYFTLFDEVGFINLNSELINIYFLPYFEGEALKDQFEKLKLLVENNKNTNYKNVLLMHLMYEQIPVEISKNFDLILAGHSHDLQEFPRGKYIGSCYQQNFAEDKYKGFTLLYNNLTTKQILFPSKEYITQTIDLNFFTEEKTKEFITNFKKKNKDKYLRIEFKGFNKDISILKDFCKQNNIDCISKIEILSNNSEEKGEQVTISTLSKEQIQNYYEEFKKNQTYSDEVNDLLNKVLFEN